MSVLECRFYAAEFPAVDEVVKVRVHSVEEMGAYVHLLEYNNIEGLIQRQELTRRRIRSINKLIRVGSVECAVVLRVDKDKGYVDLSKRRVTEEDRQKCEEKYAKGRSVHSILHHAATLLGYNHSADLEHLYEQTAWHFDEKSGQQGSAYDAFKLAYSDPEILEECDIDAETKKVLISNIKLRLAPQPVKVRADVEVACYEYEGIDAVKTALKAGLGLSREDMPVKIRLLVPPVYTVTTQTDTGEEGVDFLHTVMDVIRAGIEAQGGVFGVKVPPKVETEEERRPLYCDEDLMHCR